MPLTPTDPTKPQVWITGQAPNQILDFYIPQGPKGDPGGITLGTNLDSVSNLNIFVTSGVYRQTATPPSGLNYPMLAPGILTVYERIRDATLQSVIQEYQPVSAGNGVPVIYRRYYYGNATWTPWRTYISTRVDQTAGRVMYAWDELNNREQMIFGDTGWRTLTPANGWTSTSLQIRRDGRTVYLLALQINGSAATTDAVTGVLPLGFRANNWPISLRVPIVTGTGLVTTSVAAVDISTQELRIFGGTYTSLTAHHVITSWETNDAWPTTLPGTASGSIPNV